MKIFEVHRRAIRGISLVFMATYIATVILSTKHVIAYNISLAITFLAFIATVAQILTCIKNIEKESDCNGSNGIMQALLIWIMVFILTCGIF